MDKNALVIFDTNQDDSFLIEARDPAAPPEAGPALDARAMAVLREILASHGWRLVPDATAAPARQPTPSESLFTSTGAALVAALAMFERFANTQFAQSPAVLHRARMAAQIYRQALLGRMTEIDRVLPLTSLIWDRENGLTRKELAALGGQGRTAVALRVILSTLPRALAAMPPDRRRAGIEAGDAPSREPDLALALPLQAEQGARERRLAAAALADDAEGLALGHREVDAVHGTHAGPAAQQSAPRAEFDREARGTEDLRHRSPPAAGPCAMGRPPRGRPAAVPAAAGQPRSRSG